MKIAPELALEFAFLQKFFMPAFSSVLITLKWDLII